MYVVCTCVLCVRMYTWSPKVGAGPSAITLPTSLRQGLSLNKELIDSVWLACEVQGGTCLCPLTPPPATVTGAMPPWVLGQELLMPA